MHGWQELVETVARTWCMPCQDGVPVYVVRQLVGSREAWWASLERFL